MQSGSVQDLGRQGAVEVTTASGEVSRIACDATASGGGFMAGGGVPNAISTGGWFARAKRAMRGNRSEGGS